MGSPYLVKDHAWQTPKNLLIVMTVAMTLAFATWMALLNNFVVERAGFTGKEIGILQSIREIPGFLAFTAVFVLLLIREQIFAYISLAVLGIGVALSGYFPSEAICQVRSGAWCRPVRPPGGHFDGFAVLWFPW